MPALRSISVTLPLPPAILGPNARPFRCTKAEAIRGYRRTACMYALVALGRNPKPRWTFSRVEYEFHLPDRRRRDIDNLVAASKPALDGLVDAGILADDAGVDLVCRRAPGRASPALVVTVRPRRRRPGESLPIRPKNPPKAP